MKTCRGCGGYSVKKPPVKNKPSISTRIISIIGRKITAGGKKTKI